MAVRVKVLKPETRGMRIGVDQQYGINIMEKEQGIEMCNFMDFYTNVSEVDVNKKYLTRRQENLKAKTVLMTVPTYSSNKDSPTYWLFCK